MNKSIVLFWISFVLIFSISSCQVLGDLGATPILQEETTMGITSQDTETPTELIQELETDTPTVTETSISTATNTPTEEPSISLPVFSSPEIFTIAMFTPQMGWAVTRGGNDLLVTKDGGQSWLDATPTELDSLPSVSLRPYFLNEYTAWFSANHSEGAMLYFTEDGGENWTSNLVPFDNARYHFLDSYFGYALVGLGAGAGSHYVAIYRTLDRGITWDEVFSHEPGESKSLPESGTKNGLTFRGVDSGWIGGTIPMDDYFYLYYTEDGANTWLQETDIALPGTYSGSFLDVWQPFFVNATSGYLPVKALSPGGNFLLIYRSDDYGETWTFQNSIEDGRAVDFYSLDEGWVAAEQTLLKTIDGGVSWTNVSGSGIPSGEFFLGIDFVDSQHGWVLATPDDSTWAPLKLYRTMDGGENWTQLLP